MFTITLTAAQLEFLQILLQNLKMENRYNQSNQEFDMLSSCIVSIEQAVGS